MGVQPGLFDVGGIGQTGDPLERHYTPGRLAERCVERLQCEPRRIVEPSIGGGAFARAMRDRWPGVSVWGVDLDADAAGMRWADWDIVGSWPKVAANIPPADLVAGNPPFSVSHEHYRAACEAHPGAVVAFILPLAYLGGVAWSDLLAEHPLAEVHPIAGRPWPASIRETALYVRRPGWVGPAELHPAITGW